MSSATKVCDIHSVCFAQLLTVCFKKKAGGGRNQGKCVALDGGARNVQTGGRLRAPRRRVPKFRSIYSLSRHNFHSFFPL